MAVDETPTLPEAYAIARLAVWAGDWEAFETMFDRVSQFKASSAAEREMKAAVLRLEKKISEALRQSRITLAEFEEQEEKLIPPLETEHFRGIVSDSNEVVFELRAYLCNLKRAVAVRFKKHMRGRMREQADSNQTGSGRVWNYGINPRIQVSFSGLGQIRAVGYWCSPPTFLDVAKRFQALLERELEFES